MPHSAGAAPTRPRRRPSPAWSPRRRTGSGSTIFSRAVVPVAEAAKVRLACHPHDPYTPPGYRGVTRVLGTVEGLKRFVTMHESPYHGLNFCQGTVAEMLDDPAREIDDVIRWFGTRGKIFNVHFRNIKGRKLDFMEAFPDEGDMDMARSLAALPRGRLPVHADARPRAADRRARSLRHRLRLSATATSAGCWTRSRVESGAEHRMPMLDWRCAGLAEARLRWILKEVAPCADAGCRGPARLGADHRWQWHNFNADTGAAGTAGRRKCRRKCPGCSGCA